MKTNYCVGFCGSMKDLKINQKICPIIQEIHKTLSPIHNLILVGGWSNLGINAVAYKKAQELGWKTIGVACEKIKDNPAFDVDKGIIIGEEWGEESEKFLSLLDCLIRVGGGDQSRAEVRRARELGIPVFEISEDNLQ